MDDETSTVKRSIRIDDKSSMWHASCVTTDDFPTRFSDALVSEIKAEMGRRDLSSRGLARLIGANAQFVSSRLDGGNPRTGERVVLTVRDLAAIARALQVDEVDLVARAEAIALAEPVSPVGATVTPIRNFDDLEQVDAPDLASEPFAAKEGTRRVDEDRPDE
jgi:hypothetical protein